MTRDAAKRAKHQVECRGAPCCDSFKCRWSCARYGGYGWFRALLHAFGLSLNGDKQHG